MVSDAAVEYPILTSIHLNVLANGSALPDTTDNPSSVIVTTAGMAVLLRRLSCSGDTYKRVVELPAANQKKLGLDVYFTEYLCWCEGQNQTVFEPLHLETGSKTAAQHRFGTCKQTCCELTLLKWPGKIKTIMPALHCYRTCTLSGRAVKSKSFECHA